MINSKPSFVVGIGGSAGGLKAYMLLLKALPSDTGMAFVFIAHMSPLVKTFLTHILSSSSKMPVTQVSEGMLIQANHVYVIPPNANLLIKNDTFNIVSPRTLDHGRHMQVDCFLISLAEAMGSRAIGIILSGGDGDGTKGCIAIKAKGGITFAQDLSADVDAMPLQAQASGCVDFVLPPDQISAELVRIGERYTQEDLS